MDVNKMARDVVKAAYRDRQFTSYPHGFSVMTTNYNKTSDVVEQEISASVPGLSGCKSDAFSLP